MCRDLKLVSSMLCCRKQNNIEISNQVKRGCSNIWQSPCNIAWLNNMNTNCKSDDWKTTQFIAESSGICCADINIYFSLTLRMVYGQYDVHVNISITLYIELTEWLAKTNITQLMLQCMYRHFSIYWWGEWGGDSVAKFMLIYSIRMGRTPQV